MGFTNPFPDPNNPAGVTTVNRMANFGHEFVWHCHILAHAERESGMFGMVTAIKVDP